MWAVEMLRYRRTKYGLWRPIDMSNLEANDRPKGPRPLPKQAGKGYTSSRMLPARPKGVIIPDSPRKARAKPSRSSPVKGENRAALLPNSPRKPRATTSPRPSTTPSPARSPSSERLSPPPPDVSIKRESSSPQIAMERERSSSPIYIKRERSSSPLDYPSSPSSFSSLSPSPVAGSRSGSPDSEASSSSSSGRSPPRYDPSRYPDFTGMTPGMVSHTYARYLADHPRDPEDHMLVCGIVRGLMSGPPR